MQQRYIVNLREWQWHKTLKHGETSKGQKNRYKFSIVK